MIRISVIIPVYNVQNYLDLCMESVLSQIDGEQEIIMVDDGSTDDCPAICDKYAASYDYVTVIHQDNQGLSSARNTGIANAVGEYLLFLDSDDVLLPDAIKQVSQALSFARGTDAIMFSYSEIDEYGNAGGIKGVVKSLSNGVYSESSKELQCIVKECIELWPAWKTVVNKDMILRNRMEFRAGLIHEDVDWTSRILLLCNSMGYCESPIIGYRIAREGAITESIKFRNFDHTFRIVRDLLDFIKTKEVNVIGCELQVRLSQACFAMLRSWRTSTDKQKQLICKRLDEDADMLKYSKVWQHVCFYRVLRMFGSRAAMALYNYLVLKV